MKKKIITVAFILSLGTYYAFAQPETEVSIPAKEAFKREYPAATHPQWMQLPNSNVYSVRFVLNYRATMAYYDEAGALLATGKGAEF